MSGLFRLTIRGYFPDKRMKCEILGKNAPGSVPHPSRLPGNHAGSRLTSFLNQPGAS